MVLDVNVIENEQVSNEEPSNRPISPILNHSDVVIRKLMMHKMMQKKKTRVKLADRFRSEETAFGTSENNSSFYMDDDDLFNSTGVRDLFETIEQDEKQSIPSFSNAIKPESYPSIGTAGGTPIIVPEDVLNDKCNQLFSDILNTNQGDKGLRLRERKLAFLIKPCARQEDQRANTDQSLQQEQCRSAEGFSTASGNPIRISDKALAKFKKSLDIPFDVNLPTDSLKGPEMTLDDSHPSTSAFQTVSGNAKQLIDLTVDSATNSKIYGDSLKRTEGLLDLEEPPAKRSKSNGFQTASGRRLAISEDSLKRAEKTLDLPLELLEMTVLPRKKEISFMNSSIKNTSTEQQPSMSFSTCQSVSGFNNSMETSINTSKSTKKKRLGVSNCKQIPIRKDKLERAQLMFYNNISPAVPSTLVPPTSSSTPKGKICPFDLLDSTITPIKPINSKNSLSFQKILIKPRTEGDSDQWINDLRRENHDLKLKLAKNSERIDHLLNQKCLMQQSDNFDHTRKRKGVLSQAKSTSKRIGLQSLTITINRSTDSIITPKTSHFVHFDCKTHNSSVISTSDGAQIVPNSHDLVGLSEIEAAFTVMPGIERKLIPDNWLKNHYKWIIWKLANYETLCGDLKGSLCIENVIQQLKYRYDREIDNAERPALRKIMEKDDVAQKRMVLCVSDIIEAAKDKFELELTDGWYGIRTIVDDGLIKQIVRGKIRIGTKLLICGGQLMNCDGCHPLEEKASVVRLKINLNSTRRCVWYAKLGYQRNVEPFPVKFSSISPDGGTIAKIQIVIARVYPIRFMERIGSSTVVWRNKKAEERRCEKWENAEVERIEEIRQSVRTTRDKSKMNSKSNQSLKCVNRSDVSQITSPQTLFELYENSNDPESLQAMLSAAQRAALVDYERNIALKRDADINAEINARISAEKSGSCQRDVTPVLKLLVLDRLDDNNYKILHIWKPTDNHNEIFKEGATFTVYNVLPKRNGDLSTNFRTRFQRESQDSKTDPKYKRQFHSISSLRELDTAPIFNEFDTVGIVVRFDSNSFNQILWLADTNGRLLLLKVYDSAQNCSVFDNLKRAQVIAASNLIIQPSNEDFSTALVTHFSVISHYPQHGHLEDAMNEFIRNLPNDLSERFLNDCDLRISRHTLEDSSPASTNNIANVPQQSPDDDDDDDATLTSSRITSTDIALSMLDFDKFLQ